MHDAEEPLGFGFSLPMRDGNFKEKAASGTEMRVF